MPRNIPRSTITWKVQLRIHSERVLFKNRKTTLVWLVKADWTLFICFTSIPPRSWHFFMYSTELMVYLFSELSIWNIWKSSSISASYTNFSPFLLNHPWCDVLCYFYLFSGISLSSTCDYLRIHFDSELIVLSVKGKWLFTRSIQNGGTRGSIVSKVEQAEFFSKNHHKIRVFLHKFR